MEIPNRLTVSFACGGLVYHAATDGLEGLKRAALGAAAGMAPLLAMYMLRGIGGGDVKWFGAFGAWCGAWAAWKLTVLSLLAAGGFAVALLAVRLVPAWRQALERTVWPWEKAAARGPNQAAGGTAFPFMLAVAPAFVWQMFLS